MLCPLLLLLFLLYAKLGQVAVAGEGRDGRGPAVVSGPGRSAGLVWVIVFLFLLFLLLSGVARPLRRRQRRGGRGGRAAGLGLGALRLDGGPVRAGDGDGAGGGVVGLGAVPPAVGGAAAIVPPVAAEEVVVALGLVHDGGRCGGRGGGGGGRARVRRAAAVLSHYCMRRSSFGKSPYVGT